MEIWKIVPELSNLYQVSNYGRVKSEDTTDSWGRIKKGRILKQAKDRRGYPVIRASLKGIKKNARVHRLVASCFIPNPDKLPQVNHKDGNKNNNHYSNLEWASNSSNVKHAYDTGLMVAKSGSTANMFKSPVLVFDMDGNYLYKLNGNKEMKEKGFDYRLVSLVTLGKRKSHKKHIFKREVIE